jgi:hypothetical protein
MGYFFIEFKSKKKGKKAGKGKPKIEDDVSENLQDDDELLNMEANQQTD